MKKIIILIFLCCFVLWGCAPQKDPSAMRYVRLIGVQGTHEGQPLSRLYIHPRKMETILYYLRTLEDHELAKTDPERLAGDSYRIYVVFSDGSKSIYYQHSDRFLSRNARPWRQINQANAKLFYPLLMSLPQDQIPYIDIWEAAEGSA